MAFFDVDWALTIFTALLGVFLPVIYWLLCSWVRFFLRIQKTKSRRKFLNF